MQQLRAWEESLDVLHAALTAQPALDGWWVLIEYPMLRLGKRADVILLAGKAILALEFKVGATGFDTAACEQVEDYALDLQDFHSGCGAHPIIPIVVATDASTPRNTYPLLLPGVTRVMAANAGSLGALLSDLHSMAPPGPALSAAAWIAAPYRPVPNIVEAACMLYAEAWRGRHRGGAGRMRII